VAVDSETGTSELEELVAELSLSGSLVFVFGGGPSTAHLRGRTRPVFRGPAERRWWHVDHGDRDSNWILDVRLDQIDVVRFLREPNPYPSFPGEESLVVRFEEAGGPALSCYLEGVYDGQLFRPERLEAWERLRRRYGDRDSSAVVDGSLRPVAAAA
jgi:hypothetical protein